MEEEWFHFPFVSLPLWRNHFWSFQRRHSDGECDRCRGGHLLGHRQRVSWGNLTSQGSWIWTLAKQTWQAQPHPQHTPLKAIFSLCAGQILLSRTCPALANTIHQLNIGQYYPVNSSLNAFHGMSCQCIQQILPKFQRNTVWCCKLKKTDLHIINIIITHAHPRFCQYFCLSGSSKT